MANTVIQLKYSSVTSTPPSLNIGEPAYSFASDKLFIGNGSSVLVVGGKYFTDKVDAATALATPSTIVMRDSNGDITANNIYANIIGTITGVAESTNKLQTPRWFNISGDVTGSVVFDGTANADITLDLSDTGVVAGVYGSASLIPIITVDSEGRITSAANQSVSIPTTFSFAGDGGIGTMPLDSGTLTINGGDGISTLAFDANNTVRVDVDNTVVRTSGDQTINGDLSITGNLNISGDVTQINVVQLEVDDPILYLGANNYTSDIVDIGFVGNYFDGATQRHSGVVRRHGTDDVYIFTNYDEEFDDNLLNVSNPSLRLANTYSNLTGGRVFGLSQDIAVADGGTGRSSFTTGAILIGNGAGGLLELANSSFTATNLGVANTISSVTVDAYGRLTAVSTNPISIDASQVTGGVLPINRGGTNQSSFTNNQRVFFNGTSLASLANVSTVVTGGLSTSNTITSITVDAFGQVTAYTGAEIAIGASQITAGVIPVARGGTGNNSFTVNSVLLGNGTDGFNTTQSSTEGHVLTINSSGVPTFQHLSGGTF